MAERQRKLRVVLTARAQRDLGQIWDWNVEAFGVDHADRYVEFLLSEMEKLGSMKARVRVVPTRPDLCFHMIRLQTRGHGHIAVFRVSEEQIEVIHVFHTAMDWENRLGE